MSFIIPSDSKLYGDGASIEVTFPTLTFTSDTWGVGCWVEHNSSASNKAFLSGTDWCLYVDSSDNLVFVYRDTGDVTRTKTSALTVPIATDTEIGFVVDETEETITVNVGTASEELTITTGQEIKSRDFKQAYYDGSGLTAGLYFDGAIWSVNPRDYNTSNLDRFYPMNEGAGQIFEDRLNADGSDVITNGGFDADTDWTYSAEWSIANGVLSCDYAGGSGSKVIRQNDVLSLDEFYYVSIECVSYTSGTFRIATGPDYSIVTTVGVLEAVIFSTAGDGFDGDIAFFGGVSDGLIASFDNVSAKLTTKGYAKKADDNDWVTA